MAVLDNSQEVLTSQVLIAGAPLDRKRIAVTLVERDAIPVLFRYHGMRVFVQENNKTYQLLNPADLNQWSEVVTSGIEEAPLTGTPYARQDATWVAVSSGGGSPLITKGDLFTFDTGDARLPVGADGEVLSANSAEATGLKWIAIGGSTPPAGADTEIQFNNVGAFGASSDLTWNDTSKLFAIKNAGVSLVNMGVSGTDGYLQVNNAGGETIMAGSIGFLKISGLGNLLLEGSGGTITTNGYLNIRYSAVNNEITFEDSAISNRLLIDYTNTIIGFRPFATNSDISISANGAGNINIAAATNILSFFNAPGSTQQAGAGVSTVAELVTVLQNYGLLS